MSVEEIKKEIDEILRDMPEGQLLALLQYLKSASSYTEDALKNARSFTQILNEDSEVLDRLSK